MIKGESRKSAALNEREDGKLTTCSGIRNRYLTEAKVARVVVRSRALDVISTHA